MNYLFYKKITNDKAIVDIIYYVQPSETEIASLMMYHDGYLTKNDIPISQSIKNKQSILYCNPETEELWYEYVDMPLTKEEELEQRIADLEAAIAAILGGAGV